MAQRPAFVCWSTNTELLSLHDSAPAAFFRQMDESGHYLTADNLSWSVWYFLRSDKGQTSPTDAQLQETMARICDLCDGAGRACQCAPKQVLDEVGDLMRFPSWPTALFYLTMRAIHPLLSCHGRSLLTYPRPKIEDARGERPCPAAVPQRPCHSYALRVRCPPADC